MNTKPPNDFLAMQANQDAALLANELMGVLV